MEFELLISNEQRAFPSVQAFVHQTLRQVELPRKDAQALEQFVLRAVADAIDHAYPEGEEGAIKLTLSERHGKLEISIRDFGLPQDIRLLEERLHPTNTQNAILYGVHTPDIANEIHWEAFGREGKALRIIKWLHANHVGEHDTTEEETRSVPEIPLAPDQEYCIRRMSPDEAVQVSQLMYRTYGDSYFNEDIYYPERIAAQNTRGDLISVVAVTADGAVVGHEAVECNQRGPVAELGQAATDPAHRGRGLMSRMKKLLVEEASHLDLVGWFADAVTVHSLTQKSNANHGGHACGVELGISPKDEVFRNIAAEQTQRVSCIIYFHWLHTPTSRCIHVPPHHRQIVSEIYGNLSCPVEIREGSSCTQPHGALEVKVIAAAKVAFLSTEQVGSDSANAILHTVRELIEVSRMEAVFVDLPLLDPATPEIWTAIERHGFGFAGIGPHFSTSGDIVRLVYLVEPMAREPIETYEEFAGRLVDYALAEQQRVRSNR